MNRRRRRRRHRCRAILHVGRESPQRARPELQQPVSRGPDIPPRGGHLQASGDHARAQAATDEAQTVESFAKLANERGGDPENQNRCGVLRGNALACYDRATRLRRHLRTFRAASGTGAFLDCVKTYCAAMQSASCPMPIFGKENAGFCFTAATDDLDASSAGQPRMCPRQASLCRPPVGVSRPARTMPPVRPDHSPGSRSTKAGR